MDTTTLPSGTARSPQDLGEELYPPIGPGRTRLALPIRKVTLLEDRAQVERSARLDLVQGRARLAVPLVSPVLQDVSLRAAADGARVVDARVRRSIRVRRAEMPADVAALEGRLEALHRRFAEAAEDRARLEERRSVVLEMIGKGVVEIPEDAAWGLVQHQSWHDTLEGLMKRSNELDERALELFGEQEDLLEEIRRLIAQRGALERPDTQLVATLLIDLEVPEAATVELRAEYVTPNALWRPLHVARLLTEGAGHQLEVRTLAAVWQNTGEDWDGVELWLSTARSSLGTDPPLLKADLLAAQKKSDEVVLAQREVAVQRASVGGGTGAGGDPGASGPVDLPGVDDGGEIRKLKAEGPATVPSDGRPNLVPISLSKGPAEADRFCAPELDEKVFVRCRAVHHGATPILAGPVELIRDYGTVGWSKLLFVSPKERLELGFGPDDTLRVTRREQLERNTDAIDGWQHKVTTVQLFLSNLGADSRTVEVVERIPVSEVEHVRIALLEESTNPMPTLDDDGFCRWMLTLPPKGHLRTKLTYRVSTAPGVRPV